VQANDRRPDLQRLGRFCVAWLAVLALLLQVAIHRQAQVGDPALAAEPLPP